MSDVSELVNALESRINLMLQRSERSVEEAESLRIALQKSTEQTELQKQQIAQLTVAYEALKTANSLLGSDEHKRDTKLKINSLIREIDHCIAQLSD